MTFLAPWMLFGAIAASVPLILHFFYRARYQPHPWAAMQFLRQAVEQTSRRLRFQEFILLLLRILVLLLLALALARPATKNLMVNNGRGEAVDAIFVFDNSYSMSAKDGTIPRLERAKEAALTVIGNLPANSTVQVVTVSDRATAVGPKSPSNLDQAREIVRKIETVSLAGDLQPGLAEAVAAFERCSGGVKEVYLFSDMQRNGWERQASSIRTIAEVIRDQASFYVVRAGDKLPKNVVIKDILPQVGIPHTNTRTAFTVLLKNTGSEVLQNLEVTLEIDGKLVEKDAKLLEKLAPGESQTVTLTAKFEQSGWRVLTARIKSDDLDEDNRFDRVIQVRDNVRVLVIDGSPNAADPENSASFYLLNALVPVPDIQRAAWPIQPRVIRVSDAGPASLTDTELCILANVSVRQLAPDFIQRLGEYVREGRGLMISSGGNVDPADYNRLLGPGAGAPGLLPMNLQSVVNAAKDKPFHPATDTADPQSFLARFRENETLRNLGDNTEITSFIDLKETPEEEKETQTSRVLMRLSNGRPFLVSRRVGEGEVLFSTTSFDRSWGYFVITPTFPLVISGAMTHLLQRSAGPFNRVCGEPLLWVPIDLNKSFEVVRPNGERTPLGKPTGGGDQKLSVSFRDTLRAGVYELFQEGEANPQKFAFLPDLRESENLESLTNEQIDNQLGFEPIHMTVSAGSESFTGRERSRSEWTVWVLIFLLFLLFGEMIWALLCGRTW